MKAVGTFLCGLIGAGIQRSLAPALHEEEARHHGIRLHYQLIELDVAGAGIASLPGLIAASRIMGFAGLNITYPCKQQVMPLLDAFSDEARAIGAVNTVVREGERLVGYNTDASGWSWGFRRVLPQADLSRVALLGAGGAGSAVGYAALELGVGELAIFDVDFSRATMLAAALQANFPDRTVVPARDPKAALRSASGLIHATPIGMASDAAMPLDETLLRPAMWVSEIVHVPLETPLMKAAQRIGCATVDGGHMNVGQAIGAFKLFTGREADPARMEAQFRRLIRGQSPNS